MSAFDPSQTPEERIRQAMAQGPDLDAAGRFGKVTRLVRKFVGRAVKYERDFTLQVDSALLERIHQLEAATGEQVRAAEARLNATDDLLRDADEVLRAVDRELREADHRLRGDLSGLADRFLALEESVDELHLRLHEVDTRSVVASSVAAGAAEGFEALRQRVARTGAGSTLAYDATSSPVSSAHVARHADAAARMRAYVEIIGTRGRVVELGCGRGEMLGLLAAAGVDARGVDLDELMVDRAREAGVDVSHDDALDFLMKEEDASLGAIFSAGLIEHLPADRLAELLEVARGKLRAGGVFVAETPNPQAPGALKAFWVDPAQQHPLFPESLLALCRLSGFDAAEIVVPLGGDDVAADLATAGTYAVIARRG